MNNEQTHPESARARGLRIVLDGSPLTVATGGIRRYVEELSMALAETGDRDEVYLAADRPMQGCERLGQAGIRLHDETPTGWERRWWLLGLPRACRRLDASVFHGTDFSVPYLHRVPSVLTIHDLSPWLHPHWQPAAARIRRRTPWMLRMGLADQVITVSEAVRGEAIARFRLDAARVHAIPLAADARFRPLPAEPGASRYFLFVGTLEPRKNLRALVEAWQPVFAETGIPLKIAGRRREDFQPLQEMPGLEWLGQVHDDALPALYSGAVAVVYPSAYEGFGLPVLEAMQCGAPVVVSDAAALRELVGNAGVVVNPSEGDSLRVALRRLAIDPAFQRQWAERSLLRAAGFCWRTTAIRTREVYQEAIRRFDHAA